MRNPFALPAREPGAEQEPILSAKQRRDRDDNERFMQLLDGREDVESRVVRVLIGRALELLPRGPL
jgi:hypothetical protein